MDRTRPSVIKDQGLYASPCGYCKSKARTSSAYGLWAHSLSLRDYQDLLNRGWRRSGMFLYRPEMEKTCCPAYTIRLKADSFHRSKEQNSVMRRMERYLDGSYNGPPKGEADRGNELALRADDTNMDCTETCGLKPESQIKENHVETDNIVIDITLAVETAIKSCLLSSEDLTDVQIPKVNVRKVLPSLQRRIKILKGEPSYTSNIAFLCAAALSKSKSVCNNQWCEKSHEVQSDGHFKAADPVVLAELIASKLQNHSRLHNFKVEACRGHLNFFSMDGAASDSHKMAESDLSISMSAKADSRHEGIMNAKDITNAPPVNSCQGPSSMSGHSQSKRRRLETHMRRSAFDPEEFALFKRYQVAVHHDRPEDVKEENYRRFLVDTPLIFVPPPQEGTSFCGFGSFHQQYLIDGRLVAVGVVDILPSCLSSKYLFWEPDLAFLSLGKYSALQEIQWIQQANKYCPSMEYYYLGYYIHSCPKMRYKAAYRPSELLCPVRFLWVPFEIARPLLDERPYVCLSDYLNTEAMQISTQDRCFAKVRPFDFVDENETKNEQLDVKVGELQNQRSRAAAWSVEIASSSKESVDISNVLLKLGNRYLQFKQLQARSTVPRKYMDELVCDLRKYSQVVGLNLASRMAYALG